MILHLAGSFGSTISLDLRERFGERAELECFHFVLPPIEFRLVRNGVALQEWQSGNTEMYDLQHGPQLTEWSRNRHRFINDLKHRSDVATCGILSKDVTMETRGLVGTFSLLVWPRVSTCRTR